MQRKILITFKMFSIIIIAFLISLPTLACNVSEYCDVHDSAGYHYNVYNEQGKYIGYVSQLENSGGMRAIWIEGEGSPNDLYESKEQAVISLCDLNQ